MNTNALLAFTLSLFLLGACGDGPGYYSVIGGESQSNGQASDTITGSQGLPAELVDTRLLFVSQIIGPEAVSTHECDSTGICEIAELFLHADGTFSWDSLAIDTEDDVVMVASRACDFGTWEIVGGSIVLEDDYGTWTRDVGYAYTDNGTPLLYIARMIGFPAEEPIELPGACEEIYNPLESWE